MRTAGVLDDYEAQYPEAPDFAAGEEVALGETDPGWPGWIKCRADDGRSAWAPIRLIGRTGGAPGGRFLEDYSARELAARKGERLTVLAAESGWVWAENAEGRRGWIPQRCLQAE